jgi:hypothetical protein
MDVMECASAAGDQARRQFLTALMRVGIGAPLVSNNLDLQAKSSRNQVKLPRTRRIDVHHHFFPPRFMAQQTGITSGGRI